MSTREYLINKMEKTFTVSQYKQLGDWVMLHIDRLVTNYPHLKIGGLVKTNICGVERVTEVKEFYIHDSGILVNTGYGNVFYYETMEPSKKDLAECLVD